MLGAMKAISSFGSALGASQAARAGAMQQTFKAAPAQRQAEQTDIEFGGNIRGNLAQPVVGNASVGSRFNAIA